MRISDWSSDVCSSDLEELVEVGARDAQEAQALEQRHRPVARLGEDAEVEVQLRQLAVEVQGRVEQSVVGARLRHGGYGWRGHGSATGTGGAAACSRASTRSGPKWQLKVLPWPTSLSISSRAWCSCRMCLTIDRPRPVPPDSRGRQIGRAHG